MSAFRVTDTHVYFLGGFCSQWVITPFKGFLPYLGNNEGGEILRPTTEELEFNCCEQYMMAAKANLFEDYDTLQEIMAAKNPRDQKALGRKVKNFDKTKWDTYARVIVAIGNFYKFTQHAPATEFLELTEDRVLVEGADYDPIWGVGIAWNDDAILDEANWKGTNWLGYCIMWARHCIRDNRFQKNPWALRAVWP